MVCPKSLQKNHTMSDIARSTRERITISTLYRVDIVFFFRARESPHMRLPLLKSSTFEINFRIFQFKV